VTFCLLLSPYRFLDYSPYSITSDLAMATRAYSRDLALAILLIFMGTVPYHFALAAANPPTATPLAEGALLSMQVAV
jgi:hypothetical protein